MGSEDPDPVHPSETAPEARDSPWDRGRDSPELSQFGVVGESFDFDVRRNGNEVVERIRFIGAPKEHQRAEVLADLSEEDEEGKVRRVSCDEVPVRPAGHPKGAVDIHTKLSD